MLKEEVVPDFWGRDIQYRKALNWIRLIRRMSKKANWSSNRWMSLACSVRLRMDVHFNDS